MTHSDQQQVFNLSLAHLLKQGKQARNSSRSSCRYRSNDGLMCAVGVLIPDEAYHPDIEGHSASNLSVRRLIPYDVPGDLLNAMQGAHDFAFKDFHTEILSEFRKIAHDFKLEMPDDPG